MISSSIDSEISSVSEVAKIFDGDSFYQVQITDQKNRFPKDSVISNASVIWVFEIQFFSHVPYWNISKNYLPSYGTSYRKVAWVFSQAFITKVWEFLIKMKGEQ